MPIDSGVDLRPPAYRPAPPPREIVESFPIGVVGCGGIMRGAHLPAYRTFGYRVVAACDVVEGHARQVAEAFGIPRYTTRLEDLLDDPAIKVIDLAVPASARRPLVERIAAAGKHILSQKPLALDLAAAQAMVTACRDAGVTLMVNQQARWAPAHRALKLVLESGRIGHVYSVLHVNRSFQDVPGSWFVTLPHFNIVDHGIHYIDLARYFTGQTPQRVKATTTPVPGQVAVSPMIYTILGEYRSDAQLMTTLHFNNIVRVRASLGRNEWLVDGTEGSLAVSQTELTLATGDDPQRKLVVALQGSWFPEAFGGSMGELLTAVAQGRQPLTHGQDNLESLRIAFAAVASAESGRAVDVAEIGERGGDG
jgi:predicted dehydrogenase